MDKPDVNALAAKMIEAVRGFVGRAEEAIDRRVAVIAGQLEAKIAAVPAGPKGDKGDAGESVRGEKGDKGDRGGDGSPGKDADAAEVAALIPKPKDGAPGKDVDPEFIKAEVVRAVAALPQAKDGKDGAPGIKGEIGEPGRDAAELDVLPSIDEAKSYRRGTWASHNGGLIRASRQTEPVKEGAIVEAGWVVMVEGIAAVVATQGDDPREITVAAMLTSGTKAVTAFTVPMVIDKGVWREGEHQKGDHVSWDGSGWIAQRKTSAKPGTSPDDWRLSTKRGRDGKDGGNSGGAPAAPVVRLK